MNLSTIVIPLSTASDALLESLVDHGEPGWASAARAEIDARKGIVITNNVMRYKHSKALYFIHSGLLTPNGDLLDVDRTRLTNTFGECLESQGRREQFPGRFASKAEIEWVF